MAKYDVKFSCGHTATVELFGRTADRENKIKWYETEGLCPDCYKKLRDAEKQKHNEEEAQKAKDLGLAELTGSPKQVSWATEIRNDQMDKLEHLRSEATTRIDKLNKHFNEFDAEHQAKAKELLPDLQECLAYCDAAEQVIGSETSAARIIDERYHDLAVMSQNLPQFKKEILTGEYAPEDYASQFGQFFAKVLNLMFGDQKPAPKTVTLSPKEKKSDVLAKVSFKDDSSVSVQSPKDDRLRAAVKERGYSWTGEVWKLQIGARTGSAKDRAAEIANVLLGLGYQVTVPVEIKDIAVSGNYEPLCTRWISGYRDDPDHVYITWDRDDDEMYEQSKKLSGAKWSRGRGMCVPASSADEIEEFAGTYGFRMSAGATRRITEYRSKVRVVAPQEGAAEEKIDRSGDIKDVLNSSREVIEDLKDD